MMSNSVRPDQLFDCFEKMPLFTKILFGTLFDSMRGAKESSMNQVYIVHLPKIFTVAHIPGCWVTNSLPAISRFNNHRIIPEGIIDSYQATGSEEIVTHFEHLQAS